MKFTICLFVLTNGLTMINLSKYEDKWLNIVCGVGLIICALGLIFFVKEDEMFKNVKVIKKEDRNNDTSGNI